MLNIEDHIPLGVWTAYGETPQPEREAKILAAKLLRFHKGTAVKSGLIGYTVHVWNNGRGKEAVV